MTLRRNQPPSAESPVVIETMDAACRIHRLPSYSALRAQNEALQRDAARYRWLREHLVAEGDGDGHALELDEIIPCHSCPNLAGIDAAIDAALQDEQAAGANDGTR